MTVHQITEDTQEVKLTAEQISYVIHELLQSGHLSGDQIVVGGDAALVLSNKRFAAPCIDVYVGSELFDKFHSTGKFLCTPAFCPWERRTINVLKLPMNVFIHQIFKDVYLSHVVSKQYGFNVMAIESIYAYKTALNRAEDQNDIRVLKEALAIR